MSEEIKSLRRRVNVLIIVGPLLFLLPSVAALFNAQANNYQSATTTILMTRISLLENQQTETKREMEALRQQVKAKSENSPLCEFLNRMTKHQILNQTFGR
jgi:capsular polysaccharide biosynthesis protein